MPDDAGASMSSEPQEQKKTKPEFGRRGREATEKTERKPTAMERLKVLGRRWWPGKVVYKRKDPRGLGFKRSRLEQ